MENIRAWRSGRSLSLEDAGALIGVSGVQWHRYEAGTRRIPAEKVSVVARVTGIAPHDLRPDVFGKALTPPEGATA